MKIQVLLYRNSERREPYRGQPISKVDQVYLQDACKGDITKAEEVLQELDLLIMEATGQPNGNAFLWRAAILIGIMLAQSGEQVEAIMKLEKVKEKQIAYLGSET